MTWNKVKWIAMVSMLLDHLYKALFSQVFLETYFGIDTHVSWYIVESMGYIGRIAFPIFAYGIAQGCIYTRSASKYLLRLLLFAILSEIPFNLALHKAFIFRFSNVFFTLFLGAVCCCIYKYFRELGKAWMSFAIIFPIAICAFLFGTDYGLTGVLMIVAPYIFFSSKAKRLVSLVVMTTLLYTVDYNFKPIVNGSPWGTSWLPRLIFALLGVAVLFLYNGKPGSKKQKWVFYFVYPGHLLVYYLLSCLL